MRKGIAVMSTVSPISARKSGEACRLLEERGVGDEMYQRTLVQRPNETAGLLKALDAHPAVMADVVSVLTVDLDLFVAKVVEAKAELDARLKYGDWLLAERGLTVIEGGKQGPDVPDDFDPHSLRPVGFLKSGESYIIGTEMQRRAVEELNAPHGRKHLWWLLNHQELIPEEWKQVSYIAFAGDYDLRSSDGCQFVLGLFWGDGQWCWNDGWLGHSRWRASDRVLTLCNS